MAVRSKTWRIVRIVLAVAVLVLAALRLALPALAKSVANSQMARLLDAPAHVGGIGFRLLQGTVTVRDLRIGQPPGFGEGDSVYLPECTVQVAVGSLLRPPLVVRRIDVAGPRITVIKDAQGRLNLACLAPSSPAGANGEAATATADTAADAAPEPVPPAEAERGSSAAVRLAAVRLTDGVAHYIEQGDAGAGVDVTLSDIRLEADDLLLGAQEEEAPGSVLLTLRVDKPDELPALVGLSARVGAVGEELPRITAALRVVGLELAQLGQLVPPATRQVLGGAGLDARADLSLSPTLLDAVIRVDTSGGGILSATIGGTPDKPTVSGSDLLLGVLGRFGGQLGAVSGRVLAGGERVAEAALDTTTSLVKGVGGTAKALGTGLFGTVKKAAQGDLGGAAGELGKTAGTSLREAAGTVASTAETAAGGLADAGSKAGGMQALPAWRSGIPSRWEETWQAARDGLRERPLPERRPAAPGA